MPTIIDYPFVLQTLTGQGLHCLHYNGGVFGFPPAETVFHVGWLIADDPTLTAAARQVARVVSPPAVPTLIAGLIHLWQTKFAGPLWVLPGSHWAYELTYGGKENLRQLLNRTGLPSDSLAPRTDAAAIGFERTEAAIAGNFLTELLQMLNVTDFTAIFPKARVTVLLHHHHQLWWTMPQHCQNEAAVALGGDLEPFKNGKRSHGQS